MSRKRIYEWMLHYRNVAERRRFRIVRWKLTDAEAKQLARECESTMNQPWELLYMRLQQGQPVRILGADAVLVDQPILVPDGWDLRPGAANLVMR